MQGREVFISLRKLYNDNCSVRSFCINKKNWSGEEDSTRGIYLEKCAANGAHGEGTTAIVHYPPGARFAIVFHIFVSRVLFLHVSCKHNPVKTIVGCISTQIYRS